MEFMTSFFKALIAILLMAMASGTVTTSSEAPPPPIQMECNTPEAFPYPGSCTKYYNCMLLEGAFLHFVFECQPGSHFNPDTHRCILGQCPQNAEEKVINQVKTEMSQGGNNEGFGIAAAATATTNPCPSQGLFPHPTDCQAYYQCVLISGRMYQYGYKCQAGAYWSSASSRCVLGTCPAV